MVRRYASEHGVKSKVAEAALARETVAAANAGNGDAEWFVLSWGMGVDSTAILLRLLADGLEAHGIDPARFLVITAQTGNEFPDLPPLIEDHVLPRLRAAGVRWVQVARRNSTTASEYAVLDDSSEPRTVHLAGDYQLRDEMLDAGTLPQSGGCRKCSIKSKGWPLDAFIRELVGEAPFLHMIGFEADELGRALKDAHQGDDNRRPSYPLIDWNWNRAKCLEFIAAETGVAEWVKSACYFCPFAGQGTEKRALANRWAAFPELAADALMMEHGARSLNRTQKLFNKKTALDFARANGLDVVVDRFEAELDAIEWAVYRVRRVWTGNSRADRAVEIEATGTREEMVERLASLAAVEGAVTIEDEGIVRAVHSTKGSSFPCSEHQIVAAPRTMREGKIGAKDFDAKFASVPAGPSARVVSV